MTKQTEAMKLALEALDETLRTLDDENAKPGGAIADTIWYSPHETLFDYLAAQITALREALAEQPAQQPLFKQLIDLHPGLAEELKAMDAAQPPQEPVAIEYWLQDTMETGRWATTGSMAKATAEKMLSGEYGDVYPQGRIVETSPPVQRKPLTNEDIRKAFYDCDDGQETQEYILAFARAIEAAHGITGEQK